MADNADLLIRIEADIERLKIQLRDADQETKQAAAKMARSLTLIGGANDNIARGATNMRTAMQGLSFQLQDVVTQISAGISPLQVLVQQGGQVAGAFGPAFGPAGLLVAGAGAAAIAITALTDNVSELGRVQEETNAALDAAERAMNELQGASVSRSKALNAEQENLRLIAQRELERAQAAVEARRIRAENLLADVYRTPEALSGAVAQDPEMVRLLEIERELERRLTLIRAMAGDFADGRARIMEVGDAFDEASEKAGRAASQTRTFADVLKDLNQDAAAQPIREYEEALAVLNRTVSEGLTAQERYAQKAVEVADALEVLAENGYQVSAAELDAINRALDETEDKIKRAKTAGEEFSDTLQDGLGDIVLKADSASEALGRVLQKLAGSILDRGTDPLFTAIGDGFDSLFGGFFADGGRPPMGKVSVVGERGPELFVPNVAGTIVPNHKLGGMTYAPVINVDARNSTLSPGQIRGIVETAVGQSVATIRNQMNRTGSARI